MNKIIHLLALVKQYLFTDWRRLFQIIKLSLMNNISMPMVYYKVSAAIGLCIGLICLIRCKRVWQALAAFACMTYALLVISSTVLTRPVTAGYHYELQLFWSYKAIYHGSLSLLAEDFLNLLMLIPIGILLPVFTGFRAAECILSGLCFSLIIELNQLIFRKGFFEFDDLFHNTLGCAIGYVLFYIGQMMWKRMHQNISGK